MFHISLIVGFLLTVWLLTVIVRSRGKRMSMMFFFLVWAVRITGSAARLLHQLHEALDRFAVSWRTRSTQERLPSEIERLINAEVSEDDEEEVAEDGQKQAQMHPEVA